MLKLQESHSVEHVFDFDEMSLCAVNPSWTVDEMLNQDGIFYLKDVAKKLGLPSNDLKKKAHEFEERDISPWDKMGVRKAWTHWLLRMRTFREYYKDNKIPRIRRVDANWDGNELLAQKGRFRLKDVCGKLPFTVQQIRYQIRRHPDAKKAYGTWREPHQKSYIVDMEVFSKWIKSIWVR